MTECLIVDDSRVIRTIARRILQDLRFDVREAADGAEALKACLERMPDAVLLDWNMPVMTRHRFPEGPAAGPERDDAGCRVLQTENDLARIQEAIALGADEYIMKPFDREIVEAKLSQVGLL
jgi:two-component system, chemotaxis family, chemotaxis protein CheY